MHDRAVEAWINAFLDHWLDRQALAGTGEQSAATR
jgi:hypothetical protein